MRSSCFLAAGLLCAACSTSAASHPGGDTPAHAAFGAWGIDLASMDTTVRPGNDFYRYVNGKWLATAQIPPDRVNTGVLTDLVIQSETRSKAILADLDTRDSTKLTGEERKVRDLYHAFMDTARIEAQGLRPAAPDLAYFASLATLDDVARAMATIRRATDGPFYVSIETDDKNPNAYAVDIGQSGLGLPDRDYYLRDDPAIVSTRTAYQKHLASMLELANIPDAEKRANAVFALETAIAKLHWPASETREADKTYNPMTVSELQKLAPQFPWKIYLQARDIPLTAPSGERKVIVAEPTAVQKLAALFSATPVPVWRDYLVVHYLHNVAAYLPDTVVNADFDFYGKALQGRQVNRPRATRAYYLVDRDLGEALGKLYVARYFPPESKIKMQALVANLLKAMDADIRSVSWMSEATRAKALDKLAHFTLKIGYPDTWRDYTALTVVRDSLLVSALNAAEFDWNRDIRRLDMPVDRGEWGMTPPTVNAYYNTSLNEIVFPAAILQPPLFDPNADDAVNYGAIGGIIGHEISHGFDDQGSKYDAQGALQNWWTAADRKEFEARTATLRAQYSSYEALPKMMVNGQLTMGENIGDLSGITIALAAYHVSLAGATAPVLDGFTGDQRFFLSWAQQWRSLERDAVIRQQLLSDPHSPDKFRVLGVVRNVDAWYTAFNIQPGDTYYLAPDKRVRLW